MYFQAINEAPAPYEIINTDHFFRPWKVHVEKVKSGKNERLVSEHITEKAEANKEFLLQVFAALGTKSSYLKNLNKALWSTTHLCGILECETFWPASECGPRNALTLRTTPEMCHKITELACYVWEERFLRSGHEIEMGGWIFLDMIQV